uniref:WRKY19-like zinc finger domain-containing protein n=1 Tax=Globisporangium ultimum (strain ATCC 200006 / CBS 805.95 / DAOM BR144) TaxID=431595 RepID=K3WIA2_GLOUD
MADAAAATTPRGSAQRGRVRKHCSFQGCEKVDAGGGFCVGHGGGKKCSFPGCEKGYQTGGFCRKHGGGARCHVPGCGKVDAGKGLCRAHGGGKRCQAEGCAKADVGGGFCTSHGGGRRCSEDGCTKIDQGGGKCRAHGGAKRCKHDTCTQTARGSSGFCPDHGGAKVCSMKNCRRLARKANETLCSTCAKENGGGASEMKSHTPVGTPAAARTEETKSPSSPTSSDHEYSSGESILIGSSSIEPTSHDTCTSTAVLVSSDTSQNLDGASDKCDGTQVASCLENGCSRSFGGDCNCALNCHCIRATLDAAVLPVAEDTDPFSMISFKRYVLQIELADHGLGIDTILALISVGHGIRSVHDVSNQPLPSISGHFERSRNSHLVILRSEKTVDVTAALAPLKKLDVPWYVLEQSEIQWARKEVVVRVDEMMCPGNCGRTVVNAIRTVKHVETANLVFEVYQVVVRGRMDPNELCDAIQGVGFDAQLDAVTPLPNRFRFRVKELVDIAFVGKRLEHTLKHVDGVESVVINVELADLRLEVG